MTREEAIKVLKHTVGNINWDVEREEIYFTDEWVQAYEMAIAALRERDALLAEIKDMCWLCRHYKNGNGGEKCVNCCDEDNFEWRGAQDLFLDATKKSDCTGCRWRGVRPQRCSCCRRNLYMKDGYEAQEGT